MSTFANTVQLVGNLGTDPRIVHFENGKKVARFNFATHEQYTLKDGEKQKTTTWHTAFAWGKVATIIETYAKKGKKMALKGKLVNRPYETPEGENRYATEIRVDQVTFL